MLAINHNERSYNEFIKAGGSSKRAILLRTEPISVFPSQYSSRIELKYSLIISPGFVDVTNFVYQAYGFQNQHGGPSFGDPKFTELLKYSNLNKRFELANWRSRTGEILMLASNKTSPLRYSGYDLRRDIVSRLKDDKRLDVFGKYWTVNLFQLLKTFLAMFRFNIVNRCIPSIKFNSFKVPSSDSIKGESDNKFNTLVNYKFNFIVENSKNCITEKIFDSFLLGIIPIYSGPELNDFGIPDSTYLRLEWDLSNLEQIMQSLEKIDASKYLSAIENFINSNEFCANWLEENVYMNIANMIHDQISNL